MPVARPALAAAGGLTNLVWLGAAIGRGGPAPLAAVPGVVACVWLVRDDDTSGRAAMAVLGVYLAGTAALQLGPPPDVTVLPAAVRGPLAWGQAAAGVVLVALGGLSVWALRRARRRPAPGPRRVA